MKKIYKKNILATALIALIFSFMLPSAAFADSVNYNVIQMSESVATLKSRTTSTQGPPTNRTITTTSTDLGISTITVSGAEVSCQPEEQIKDENTIVRYICTLSADQQLPESVNIALQTYNNSTREQKVTKNGVTKTTTTEINKGFPFITATDYDAGTFADDYQKYAAYINGTPGDDSVKNTTSFTIPINQETKIGELTFYYYYSGDFKTRHKCTIIIKAADVKLPAEASIISTKINTKNAQWMEERLLYTEEGKVGIISKADSINVEMTLDNDVKVLLDDQEQVVSNKKTTLNLTASLEGTKHTIKLQEDGYQDKQYTVTAYKQKYDDSPDAVVDYISIGSQFTNGNKPSNSAYGTEKRAVSTLRGIINEWIPADYNDEDWPPVSVGNFGSYITYYYENAIYDDPQNPYGVDFIIYGNAVSPNLNYFEPGNVLVSEDGSNWYTLAGSLHYDNTCTWNYEVQYSKNDKDCAVATLPDNTQLSPLGEYPKAAHYSMYAKNNHLTEIGDITVRGTYISPAGEKSGGNTVPTFPTFGYADCGLKNDTNQADNPYADTTKLIIGEKEINHLDGFDLAWAVDENGLPHSFENGIHYVKVQTATLINNTTGIGEKSTEINLVRKAQPSNEKVGKTANAEKITIDGVNLTLEPEKYVYEATVSGVFDVEVQAEDGANIYINSQKGNIGNFEKAAHGIVRIIIQEGEKEPVIYYIKITDDGFSKDNRVTKVAFDANKGFIGEEPYQTFYFDKNSVNAQFPTPVREGYTFEGWFDKATGQKKIDKYNINMNEEVHLVAKWKETRVPVDSKGENVTVTFRLIGSTLAKPSEVDLSKGKEGFCDAKYVTWIPTKKYTVPKNSTVYDLFVKAMEDARLKEEGAAENYVSTIYAPTSLGGYPLSEFTNGKYSGWMYTKNGVHTNAIKDELLSDDGIDIIFHYVNDYRYEIADWGKLGGTEYPALGDGTFHNSWLEAADTLGASGGGAATHVDETKAVTTSGTSGSSTTTTPTEVTVSGTTATATVKSENAAEAIKQAKENKSAEIVLNVAASDTKGAETVKVQLDTATVKAIVSDTSASLTVKTENGQVSLDCEALTTVVSEAKGATITLEVVKVLKPTEAQQKAAGANGYVIRLVIKSGDKIISDFNKGKATVTVEIPTKLQNKKVAAIHIAEDGKIEQLPGKTVKIDGKDYYIFETPHFSTFALVDAEELGLEVNDEEANIVKIKELVSDMSLKASSSKTSKKNIKVTLTVDKSTAAAIKEIKDMGYTVKYKYYRSTKKASKYQAKITKTTKTFTNTAGKKGTRYYYKARIQVYDKDGKLITQTALKQCKYAVRTWTK